MNLSTKDVSSPDSSSSMAELRFFTFPKLSTESATIVFPFSSLSSVSNVLTLNQCSLISLVLPLANFTVEDSDTIVPVSESVTSVSLWSRLIDSMPSSSRVLSSPSSEIPL